MASCAHILHEFQTRAKRTKLRLHRALHRFESLSRLGQQRATDIMSTFMSIQDRLQLCKPLTHDGVTAACLRECVLVLAPLRLQLLL